jgi:class 3 adenylate cyclase
MRCPSCHQENRSGRRFCTQCGTELAVGCPSCGAPIETGEKFCGGCGAALTIDGRTTTPSPAHASLLTEKMRQAKAAVAGERKQVTVLFVDVKGSMKLAEQLDPEAWSQIMQRFFRIFCDSIERFEGFVDKFTGDHAQRACYAALHLRDAVRTYASEVRAQHGLPFAVRIGLNSGEVVVGRIGDDLRMEFTAQGHVVGLAQRMEALAESGHICLSATRRGSSRGTSSSRIWAGSRSRA